MCIQQRGHDGPHRTGAMRAEARGEKGIPVYQPRLPAGTVADDQAPDALWHFERTHRIGGPERVTSSPDDAPPY